MAQRIIKAIFYRPGPPGPPGNLPGLYYTAEEIDEFLGDYALTTALDALLPIADVLNEPDMATGATDKPPSQASVVEYVANNTVPTEDSLDLDIHHGFLDADDRASWLTGTTAGLPPEHSRHIITEAVAALLSQYRAGIPEDMPPNTGWIFAIVDEDDYIAFGIRDDGSVWPEGGGSGASGVDPIETDLGTGNALLVKEPDGTLRPYTSTTNVAFWGDSLTEGFPSPPFEEDGSDSMPGVFATLYAGGDVANLGYSGKTAAEIAIRQGGLVIELLPAGNEIPASGGVTVTTPQAVGWRTDSPWSTEGTLAGVPGTLSRTGSTLTFTRASAGDAVPVTEPTPFLSTVGDPYLADVTVICAGRNDVSYLDDDPDVVDRVVAATVAMVESLTPRYPRFLLLGTLTSTNETAGTSGHTIVTAINRRLERLYPDNFWDYRRWLIDDAMDAMGLAPDATDLAKIAGDTLPPSIMHDTVHYLPETAAAAAQRIYDELTQRGWI